MMLVLMLTATTAWAFEAIIELEKGPYVYKGNDTPVKPKVTRVVFDGVDVESNKCTITYGNNCVAGKDKGEVTVKYNDDEAVMKFDIQRAPLTVTAASATKVYDGTPLTNGNYTIEGLMPDDEYYVKLTVTGSQTEVGSSYNVPSNLDLLSGIEDNYDITYVNGTLTVTWQGAGTKDDPYIINNTGGLDMLATNVNAGNDYKDTYFQLGDDITYSYAGLGATENNYTAIGCKIDYNTKYPFKGHFDGNGKTISGIRIYKSSNDFGDCYQGLFGFISGTAEVKNVILADARITGFGNTGGIVGWIEVLNEGDNGSVCNCHVLSNVTIHAVHDHTDSHGGIVGNNNGSVTGCTSAASITIASGLKGSINFGGIVGNNSGSVTDCLYLGTTLNGNLRVGAIAGAHSSSSSVKNCYYTSTTITGKDQSGNEIVNASCAVGFNNSGTVTNCGLAQHTITLGTGVALTNATEYNVSGLTGYGNFALSYNDGITTNIYVLEGATVTVNYNGGAIPSNSFWKVTYIDGNLEEKNVTVTDNKNGTYSFTMPAYNVTAAVYKDFTKCTAYVPNQTPYGSYICYKFWDNPTQIGALVKDGDKVLTVGTDYEFGQVYYYNTDAPDKPTKISTDNINEVGERFTVEIRGKGSYSGTVYAHFEIIGDEAKGTWGTNLSWSLANGTLTITGSGAMDAAASYDDYPWCKYAGTINTINLDDNITTIAAAAFGGTNNVNPYANVTSVSLPSTLESIGDNAFAYCTALTVNLDDILKNPNMTLANISQVTPFNQVGKFIGTLYDGADNAKVFDMMVCAQKAKVTIKGRKLWRDGDWNTLCLPFMMSSSEIAASQLAGATIKQLDVTGIYDEGKQTGIDGTTLNLYFKEATSIEAGMPYLIKWETTGDPITDDLVFDDVKVYGPMQDVTSQDNKVTFKGNYSKQTWDTEDKSILFLGAANHLYWPQPNGENIPSLGAFRAYFQLSDGQQVSAISLNFNGDEATGVKTTNYTNYTNYDGAWYDLSGRKIAKPTQKGVYIHNGRKVVIK